jgi:ATP-dependent helicase/nuclease subunit A
MNNYTPEQMKAIQKSGSNILVSASAGSGKTTVLIERILNKLKNDKWNIDEMLIVTFTEAAANEMKQRLRSKLNKEILEHNEHLKKQLMHIANAQISTFHSFCNGVIQKFFYLIDADAKYKISEDVEIFLISEDVLEILFNELYEAHDEMFMKLVKRFTSTTHDTNLKNIINETYKKLRTIPYKDEFMQNALSNYNIENNLKSWNLYPYIKNNLLLLIKHAENCFKKAFNLASSINHNYVNQYTDDMTNIDTLRKLIDADYDDLYNAFKNTKFVTFSAKAKKEDNESVNQLIKDLRDEGKDVCSKKIVEKYFLFGEKSNIKFITKNKEMFEALFYVINLYDKRFKAAKKERNLVDFSDLEEMTLQILTLNNNENEATEYYKSQFKEILVDEFQDTSSMQETIINAISNHKNIFMVGDVKQSIYRFRSAEPKIFQTKYKKYGIENNEEGLLINLNANYRSREEVLCFINYIFSQIMDETVGEIMYDEKASLKFGQTSYPKIDEKCVSLHILEKNKINASSDKLHEKSEIEAHYVAQKIREIIDHGTLVFDKNGYRLATYKDIVILSRTKAEQDIYNEVFKQYNIPFLTQELAGYFNSIEVMTTTSILKIIDNPLQDIPFIASMRSPIFNINEKELIDIKVKSTKSYYYEKVLDYIKTGNNANLTLKLKQFIHLLHKWREDIKNESLSALLYAIYHETNYYDFVLGQIGGKQRQANLDLLYDRAKDYENLTTNSLFKFINLINFLNDNDKDLSQARTVGDNEDLVRFMSIHKSKGLEFPFVFITNLSKKYNINDEESEILFDKDLGIAFSYLDLDYRVKYDTLYQRVIKDKIHKQMLAEEMRLLYVALTRAKEKLFLVGTVDDIEKEMKRAQNIVSLNDVVLPESERQVTNYLSLILLAMYRHPFVTKEVNKDFVNLIKVPNCDYIVVNQIDFELKQVNKQAKEEIDFSKYFHYISERLKFSYPYKQKTLHFAKQTIADVKRVNQGISEYNYLQTNTNYKIPKFFDKMKSDATLRGTSFHQFMQHINYGKTNNYDDLLELKNKLINNEILTKESADLVDLKKIHTFLQTDLAKKIHQNSIKIQKELPFTTLIDSKIVYKNEDLNEDILIQGVIDLFVLFDDEAYILDFKSDRVKDDEDDINRLKKQYSTQINMYKEAIQRIYANKKIKALLYLFEINRFIEM